MWLFSADRNAATSGMPIMKRVGGVGFNSSRSRADGRRSAATSPSVCVPKMNAKSEPEPDMIAELAADMPALKAPLKLGSPTDIAAQRASLSQTVCRLELVIRGMVGFLTDRK